MRGDAKSSPSQNCASWRAPCANARREAENAHLKREIEELRSPAQAEAARLGMSYYSWEARQQLEAAAPKRRRAGGASA